MARYISTDAPDPGRYNPSRNEGTKHYDLPSDFETLQLRETPRSETVNRRASKTSMRPVDPFPRHDGNWRGKSPSFTTRSYSTSIYIPRIDSAVDEQIPREHDMRSPGQRWNTEDDRGTDPRSGMDGREGTALGALTPAADSLTIDDVVGAPRYTVLASQPHLEQQRETYGSYALDGRQNEEDNTGAPNLPQISRYISGGPGEVEELDPSYRVRNYDWQKFFRPGRVFCTLWTDAFTGANNDSDNDTFMSSVSYVIYKERVHSKIRRFVVVRVGDRCCTCLPVTTYAGNGHRKRGIKLQEHGLIYSGEKPAGIKGIQKLPLKVRLSKGADKLSNPSYINYGRVYTVETSVKVKDVGELDSESRKHLRAYYNQINTLPDDDHDGPGPALTSQARSTDLAGVGGAVIGTSYSSTYSSSLFSLAGSTAPASTSYPRTSMYQPVDNQYPQASSSHLDTTTYQANSTPTYSIEDPRSALRITSTYSPISSPSISGPYAQRDSYTDHPYIDSYASETKSDDWIDLPTLEEAQASRPRRENIISGRNRAGRHWRR